MIISGIIEQDAKNIEEHFSADPLTTYKVITEKEWVCYRAQKKSREHLTAESSFCARNNT